MNRFIIEATVTLRWLIYPATFFFIAKLRSSKLNLLRSRRIFRVRLPSCVWFSRKYLHLYATIRTHTRNSSSRGLCSLARFCEDTRAYFVGSGPRHYFEIHEVEWRNRVRSKFGTGVGGGETDGGMTRVARLK